MLLRFIRTVIGDWRIGVIAIFSAILFSLLYMISTGIVSFVEVYGGYLGSGFYVYEAYRDPYIINTIYLLVIGNIVISISPLAAIFIAVNSALIGLNIGAIIRAATNPGCCGIRVGRSAGVLAGSVIPASLGIFTCCGGGLLIAMLGSLGLWGGIALLRTYGIFFQAMASIVLLANLIYLYKRLSRAGIPSNMNMRLRLDGKG
ncbi:MAG: hypothetical protein QXE01_05440 [Sulfolobales archaeon]